MAGDGNLKITLGVDPIVNLTAFNAEIDRMQASLKAKPIVLSTGLNKTVLDNDAKSMFKTVEQQANLLDNVIITYEKWTDAHGKAVEGITKLNTKWVTSNGEVYQSVRKVKSDLDTMDKSGAKLNEVVTATVPLKQILSDVSKEYEKQSKSITSTLEQGEKYAASSKNWSAPQREQMQKLNETLKIQATEWLNLAKAGQGADAALKAEQIEKTSQAMSNLNAGVRVTSGLFSSLSSHIGNAIKQTIAYTFSLGTLRAAQQLVNEAIQFTIDLNKEMINIQVLQANGAQTSDEIENLATSYNHLAKEMGATTVEIAQGSTEWLRQGKTIAETTELLKASTMLSKLGALSAADATNYLTSTINSYKLGTKDAISVVDKLVAVDNESATSTAELATALKYVAAQASESGVSLDQLVSYIGVLSSTTRQNAESIGQALKTMFTRMEDIKAGAIDEDGLGINNVEISLNRANIALRNTDGTWRDLGDTLEEVASKWNTLDDIQQKDIAKSIAGTRQRNLFTVLMNNMNEAMRLQEVQYNATGLAADRYKIYLQGVEASQNKLKASAESLFLSLNSFDKTVATFFNMSAAALDFLNNIGGLPTAITMVTAALIAMNSVRIVTGLNNATDAVFNFINGLGASTKAIWANVAALLAGEAASESFNIAIASTGVGIIALVAGGLVSWLMNVQREADNAAQKLDELSQKLNQTIDDVNTLSGQKSELTELWNAYSELKTKVEELGSVSALTTDEQKEYYSIQTKILELSPSLIAHYDNEGRAILDEKTNLQELLDLKKEEIRITNEKLTLEASDAAKAASDSYTAALSKLSVAKRNLAEINGQVELNMNDLAQMLRLATGSQEKYELEIAKAENEFESVTLKIKQDFAVMGDEARNAFIKGLRAQGREDIVQALLGEDIVQIEKSPFEDKSGEMSKTISRAGTDAQEASTMFEKLRESIDGISTGYDGAAKAVQEYGASSSEAYEALQKAVGEGKDITKYLNSEGAVDLKKLAADNETAIAQLQKDIDSFGNQIAPEAKAALQTIIDKTREAWQEFDVFGVKVSGTQFMDLAKDASTSIWQVVEDAKAASISVGDTTMYTADQVLAYIKTHPENLQALINSLVQISAVGASEVVQQWQSAAAAVVNAIPMPDIYNTTGIKKPGSGGGSSQESAEEKQLKATIKLLDKKKEKYKDQLDAFNKYIAAQKNSLKLQKEEADFADALAKKNKSLADLKTQIEILSLDNSAEARAKRLELEDQASDLEEEITKDTEDRKYDLQIEALDKLQQNFEDKINAQIDALDKTISKYNDEISAIKDAAKSVGGISAATQTLGVMTQEVGDKIVDAFSKQLNLSEKNRDALQEQVDKLVDEGAVIEGNYEKLWAYAQLLANVSAMAPIDPSKNPFFGTGNSFSTSTSYAGSKHSGGVIETHHDGDFAGGLKTNEVFAKLLKGEYVVNKETMGNFLSNILPKIASSVPYTTSKNNQNVNATSVNMPVTINGNVDDNTLAKLEKMVMKVMNNANKSRGMTRAVETYSV